MIKSKSNFLVFLFSFLTIFLMLHPSAHADLKKGPAAKLARGVTYLVTSPFQLPKEIIVVTSEEESAWLAPWKGMSAGVGSGLYHMGRQGIAGLWDIVTFWTPAARDWRPLFETSLIPEV